MKLSYTIIILGLLLGVSTVTAKAQGGYRTTRKEKKADYFFERQFYKRAIALYEDVLQRQSGNARVQLKVAEGYYQLNDVSQAVQWYEKGADASEIFTLTHQWHYVQVLARDGRRDAARQYLEEYLKEIPTHQAAQNLLMSINNHASFYEDSATYTIIPLNINDTAADFSPTFYKEGLVFASARRGNGASKIYQRDETAFLRLLYAVPTIDSSMFSAPQPLLNRQKTELHEGPVTFFNQDTKMIFTTNNPNFKPDNKQKIVFNRLQLQYAENTDGQWSTPVPLPFNSDDYSTGHPTVSSDGKTLYFASDRPGGLGGTDLYVSYFRGGQWETPINLGQGVNTDGDEMFPSLHQDTVLYFASDGQPGLGGLDLFLIAVDQLNNGTPKNLGVPINSTEDDFGLAVQADSQLGYFSSRRAGQDDLYRFVRKEPTVSEDKIELIVRVKDGITNQYIPNTWVALDQQEHPWKAKYTTNEKGEIRVFVDKASVYDISGKLDGEFWDYLPIRTHTMSTEQENIYEVVLFQNVAAIESMDIVIFDRYLDQGDVFVGMNNEVYTWQERDGKSFLVGNQKEIMLYRSNSAQSEVGLEKKIDDILMQEGVITRSITYINNIHFDFDKHDIRQDAQEVLDKLITVMQEYPSLRINAGAHTDSRGSNQYNQKLSQRRANAAMEYMLAKGIETNRLMTNSFGEQQLFNACSDGTVCNAKQHQANRRVEFGIIEVGMGVGKAPVTSL